MCWSFLNQNQKSSTVKEYLNYQKDGKRWLNKMKNVLLNKTVKKLSFIYIKKRTLLFGQPNT